MGRTNSPQSSQPLGFEEPRWGEANLIFQLIQI